MNELDRIANSLEALRTGQVTAAAAHAAMSGQLAAIRDHLATINGRVGKNEEKIRIIEDRAIEARGAMRVWVLVASTVSAAVAWLVNYFLGRHT